WLERAALQRADFWCSVCQYTAKRTQQAFNIQSKATAILYNPVELTVTPRGSERSTHVVFTGTLTFKKGVESLIRAWPLVIAECPDAFLHVYGKDGRTARGGSMRAHLEWLLPDHAHRSVRFHDHVPRAELLETLAQAAAAVFPSFAETFAMAPLEAMACGCPTIYSRRGSGRELIEDSRDGLLVDPGRPQEIAAAIVRLLRDRAFARKLGEAGRQRVSTVFSMAKLLPENVAFYEACIDSFQAKDTSAKLAVDRTAPQSVL
ncbi:MAG: glycosyltransferase family 4 protein, partial [Acidobacteriia bacterium]|nr:glycosyltransferase family 4 protein [Terriglobia bacterium]